MLMNTRKIIMKILCHIHIMKKIIKILKCLTAVTHVWRLLNIVESFPLPVFKCEILRFDEVAVLVLALQCFGTFSCVTENKPSLV